MELKQQHLQLADYLEELTQHSNLPLALVADYLEGKPKEEGYSVAHNLQLADNLEDYLELNNNNNLDKQIQVQAYLEERNRHQIQLELKLQLLDRPHINQLPHF